MAGRAGHPRLRLARARVRQKDDPTVLAVLALVYLAVQLVGMSLFGVTAWERNADAFGVYFGFLARLSPLDWRVIGANGVWYVQAPRSSSATRRARASPRRALVVYDDPRAATRSQYWMLAVMVGFTSLGLFILSAAAQ